jgi:probable HAF family extracellular repeat protein
MNRLFICLLVLIMASFASAEIRYTITDLGMLEDSVSSIAVNVNEAGQVAGWSEVSPGTFHGFFYDQGVKTDMGTFGGTSSYAFGLNNTGAAVGSAACANGNLHAFLYQNGQKTDLGTNGKNISEALGINNAGVIVGYTANSNTSTDSWTAFVYEDGQMVDLNSRIDPGSGWVLMDAWGINNLGQITGEGVYQGQSHAFLYSEGTVTDLGSLGGWSAFGVMINDSGQVVGGMDNTNDERQAFYWDSSSGFKNLGNFGGAWATAYAINASGLIVGEADDGVGRTRAFLYQDNTLLDLNTLIDPSSGWSLEYAEDINNEGQIIGMGTFDGVSHAVLLNPVPEPATLLLLVLSMGLLRKKRS